jgi:hypothetical protein
MKTLMTIGLLAALLAPALTHGQPAPRSAEDRTHAKRMAWATWRTSHTNVLSLQRTIVVLADMQDDPVLRAEQEQAVKILSILETWRKRSSLSDEQAKTIDSEIKKNLSSVQMSAIRSAKQPFAIPPIPKSTGLPGSGRPMLSSRDFPWPRSYNPLRPESIPLIFLRAELQSSMKALVNSLRTAAKQLSAETD